MKFWMLYVEGGGAPAYRHSEVASANTEAERLARLNPGKKVFILVATGCCALGAIEWHDLDEGVPF